jgi:hypothetical protein
MEDQDGHRMLHVGEMQLTVDDAERLLGILWARYKGALGGAMAEMATGVAYSAKAPAGRERTR